jgi:hypothetical protein
MKIAALTAAVLACIAAAFVAGWTLSSSGSSSGADSLEQDMDRARDDVKGPQTVSPHDEVKLLEKRLHDARETIARLRGGGESEPEEGQGGGAPPEQSAGGRKAAGGGLFPVSRERVGALLARILGKPAPEERVDEAYALAIRTRDGGLSTARNAESTAARAVAEAYRKELAYLEDKARGGAMNLLRGLQGEEMHLLDLVADSKRFSDIFSRVTPGPTLDGSRVSSLAGVKDGSLLAYPAGMFKLNVDLYSGKFPSDVLIKGEGMDYTLVRLNEISTRHEIRSLTFKDLTIDCGDDYFTDLRHDEPALIRLVRCRVIRFDMGAGGSVMLAANTAAFYAQDCRIESGYGRSPGSGNLFRVRDGLLARLENCLIKGPFRSIFDEDDAATYVFSNCEITGITSWNRDDIENPPEGVRFENCRLSFMTEDEQRSHRSGKVKPLSAINPDWK